MLQAIFADLAPASLTLICDSHHRCVFSQSCQADNIVVPSQVNCTHSFCCPRHWTRVCLSKADCHPVMGSDQKLMAAVG